MCCWTVYLYKLFKHRMKNNNTFLSMLYFLECGRALICQAHSKDCRIKTGLHSFLPATQVQQDYTRSSQKHRQSRTTFLPPSNTDTADYIPSSQQHRYSKDYILPTSNSGTARTTLFPPSNTGRAGRHFFLPATQIQQVYIPSYQQHRYSKDYIPSCQQHRQSRATQVEQDYISFFHLSIYLSINLYVYYI